MSTGNYTVESMGRYPAAFLASLLLMATASADGYGSLQIDSGEQRVALIELYTSEGCSSCPPADRWLSDLRSDDRLWQDYVPIALHVDYWNYIGWVDRFSKPGYSDRQRNYVQNGGARVAYTPGFFSNGSEWRGWFSGDALTTNRPSVGNLGLGMDGSTVAVRFDPVVEIGKDLVVNIAILGMQLESDVRAGENNGRKLRHDFVVLNLQSVEMLESAGVHKAAATIDHVQSEANQLALVAWISAKGDQTPLQSVGGYLPNE